MNKQPVLSYQWFWLSFADPTKPRNQQFLGAVIVHANCFEQALKITRDLKINPGGECRSFCMSETPDPKNTNRLLSKEEILRLDIGERDV